MQSSLKKTLYLGLAAISLGAAAGFSTPAQAASKAKVTSDKVLTTKAETRNINLTGANAIYSKPGTVKGAKLVATTQTAKNLKDSTSSHKNFRAYRVATTNRGSVYYKVVSFDKHSYRGWVYGGKSTSAFAGGLTSYDTFKLGTVTDDQKNGTFKLKNAGTGLDGVTYTQPAWTQYKVGRAILDTTAYKDATFTVDQAGSRTREGDQWVHIKNQNTKDTKADGWILASNLTQTNAFNENTQIKVVVKDINGKILSQFNHTVANATKKGTDATSDVYLKAAGVVATKPSEATLFGKTLQGELDANLKSSGYKVAATDTVNQVAVKTGDTLTLIAKIGDQTPTRISVYKSVTGVGADIKLVAKGTTDETTANAGTTVESNPSLVVTLPTLTTPFAGPKDASYSSDDVKNNLAANKATTFSSQTIYLPANATIDDVAKSTTESKNDNTVAYHVEYTFDHAFAGSYSASNSAQAVYSAKLVKNAATPSVPGTTPGQWDNGTAPAHKA